MLKHEEWFENHVSEATDRAFAAFSGGTQSVYLYVQPSTESEYGKLYPLRDGDEDQFPTLELVTGERISGYWPRTRIRAFIHKAARSAPLYPTT